MTRPEIELRSPGPLANTLTARPMDRSCKKLTNLVEGDPKASFSIATTSRYIGGALLNSLDFSTLPLVLTFKAASSTIFEFLI